ncbi:uncharacterized protein LOC119689411 [Teleopsis dalmanni]|uniref:uncharacterized protein LOC119689411 n=1 Tax=Teleopsis dalmanni TaxID=139649 RepID=UPI0018CD8C53|nr:uncharacterized protein LOC119689411 [Teleopsis dalmanni]
MSYKILRFGKVQNYGLIYFYSIMAIKDYLYEESAEAAKTPEQKAKFQMYQSICPNVVPTNEVPNVLHLNQLNIDYDDMEYSENDESDESSSGAEYDPYYDDEYSEGGYAPNVDYDPTEHDSDYDSDDDEESDEESDDGVDVYHLQEYLLELYKIKIMQAKVKILEDFFKFIEDHNFQINEET